MAPHLLMLAVCAALWAGCAEAPELTVDAPLLIFDSYPASGASVARGDLAELAVVFTADLGEPAEAAAQADHVTLADADGPIAIVRPDRTNVAYDRDAYLLRVELDPEVVRALRPGTWTLTVGEAITAADGRPLPHDYVVRFTLVD
jgi:hypothetical protein